MGSMTVSYTHLDVYKRQGLYERTVFEIQLGGRERDGKRKECIKYSVAVITLHYVSCCTGKSNDRRVGLHV